MSSTRYHRPPILDSIRYDQHSLIEADAGTGKTYTIEHLVLDLLISTRCTVEEILVVTFTEKATAELRKRIREQIERVLSASSADASEPQDIEPVVNGEERELTGAQRQKLESSLFAFDRAPIFTIHAFCQRLLNELAFDSAVRFDLKVVEGRGAFHQAFRAELREHFAVDADARDLLNRWLEVAGAPSDSLEELLYEAHRNRYLDLARRSARWAEAAGNCGVAAALEPAIVDLFLPRIAERLDREKRRNGEIDFDDMLAWVWSAIEGPRGDVLVAAMRARWRHAVIDEFQDTDDLQWRIFRRVFCESGGANLLHLVGDPKQAIYAFRGADVFSYLSARAELQARGIEKIALKRNFRSTPDLIEACNLILAQNTEASIFTGEIRFDQPAQCGDPSRRARDRAGRAITPVTLLRYAPAQGRRRAAQMRAALARRIAAEVRQILFEPDHAIFLTGEGNQPRRVMAGDIYVLTRTTRESDEIGEYLRDAGVPFAFYKQEGLFQTDEARDVLAVLRALEEPGSHSRRLKAWATPFFAIPFERLGELEGSASGDSLNETLFEWRELADKERFVELFDRLVHESGLACRELLLASGERRLTNYLHILEILLHEALHNRWSLSDLAALLASYVNETAHPPGINGNLQRIESERHAVQVMTVHMSKGLEAGVVFLFGLTAPPPNKPEVAVYHDGHERRIAIGKAAKEAHRAQLRREEDQEDQRLIYVALTRARAKLYLPLIPPGSTIQGLRGFYARLNARLEEIMSADRAAERDRLFAIDQVRDDEGDDADDEADLYSRLRDWKPPVALLRDDRGREIDGALAELRYRRAPPITCSYTSLGGAFRNRPEIEQEYFKYDAADAAQEVDLPGARQVGIFLHEVIEKVDLEELGAAADLASWKALPHVSGLFAETMRRHQVNDRRWAERGPEIVFNALRLPIRVTGGTLIGPLCECSATREMEFVYPIPERSHLLLASPGDGSWQVERGYIRGFVDLVFEHNGLFYFADWKSDLLPDYGRATIEAHVTQHYETQAIIYSIGIIRLLRIRNEEEYRRRFGGLLYLFIRGLRADEGVYFHRAAWAEIQGYEAGLMRITTPIGAPR